MNSQKTTDSSRKEKEITLPNDDDDAQDNDLIPCETCGDLVPLNFLLDHQTSCTLGEYDQHALGRQKSPRHATNLMAQHRTAKGTIARQRILANKLKYVKLQLFYF